MNVPIPADDIAGLAAFASQEGVGLTLVGPEAPLAAGIVDHFQAEGLRIFGPSQAAAQLEASKAFAKAFMAQHGIPTARYGTFDNYAEALAFLDAFDGGIVVKADGLAAGKGVVVCETNAEARAVLARVMVDRIFGSAGDKVVIEERLSGPEVSIMAFCDGKSVALMPAARDHKRAYDGDTGPNTGGMGAFAPAPDVSPEMLDAIRQLVLEPVVQGMAACGTPYQGVLYAGLMLTGAGPQVLEFNCRFGDPETQAALPLLASDLVEAALACVNGELDQTDIKWHSGACATVVLASPGYPDTYPKGLPISGLDSLDEETFVFHAGTARQGEQYVTSGGRVLSVTGRGDDLTAALSKAYQGVEKIHFHGVHYRRDIGGYGKYTNP